MKKSLIALAIIMMAMSTMACKGLPTNFNTWGKITDNVILENACPGFVQWAENAQEVDQEYDFEIVSGNDTVTVTALVTPTVLVDNKYTVIIKTDSLKTIVKVGDKLITGTERDQAILKAIEIMQGIPSVTFTFSARSAFLNFGRLAVNEQSISCNPKIFE